MYLTYLKKSNQFLSLSLFTIFLMFFSACQKEISSEGGGAVINTLPDLTAQVNSSVSGFVTDENNAAVAGALVKVGTATTSTNRYGFFEVKNVQVIKNAALVTVSNPGYFNGIKTFIAEVNKAAFFRIKLIPKNTVGTIDASVGGAVTLSNGLIVALPASAVVTASTNTAYTGTINVAAHWISPTATDLNSIMPGDLRGLDSVGLLKSLTTYGMVAVELSGTSGQLLQIAPGKKATLTIPLPPSIAAAAPTILPLWYFDESLGLWKQEGSAIKTGSTYVGEVSHFSYWNCDVPNNYVRFSCTVLNTAGLPVQNAFVKVSVVSNPNSMGFGYTDSAGYTGGAVPNNTQLLLEIFSDYNCGVAVHSQNFSTTTINADLGNITIANTSLATVSGNVTNCVGAAVTNGYVIMNKGGINYSYAVDNTGTFNFTTTLCSGGSTSISLVAVDNTTLQGGNSSTFTINSGANVAGTLTACGTSISQYINYTINGTNYSIAAPVDSLTQFSNPQSSPSLIYIYGNPMNSGTVTNAVNIAFTEPGIAVNSTQTLESFFTRDINDSTSILTPIPVNITEYGAVGQYISGNFTGTLTGGAPANTPYVITCTFRVRRSQ